MIKRLFLMGLFLLGGCALARDLPQWDLEQLSVAPEVQNADVAKVDGLQALYVKGLDYKGRSTWFFAYLGFPENMKGRVPAVILVHGGGGTALANWAKYWNSKGYAALVFDNEGQVPVREANHKNKYRTIESLNLTSTGAPRRSGAFEDHQLPDNEQWLYHAVANSMLSVSYLAAHPQVDAQKIGIVGISWGSVICSIVGGIDQRLEFVVSQYIGGNLNLGNHWYGYMKQNPDIWRWDPANFYFPYKGHAKWLWINSLNDKYGLPPMTTASWQGTGPDSWMTFLPTLRHSHFYKETGSNALREIYAFADSVTRGTPHLTRILQTKATPELVRIKWVAEIPVHSAELCYTTNAIPEKMIAGESRKDWESVRYDIRTVSLPQDVTTCEDGIFSAAFTLPPGTQAGVVNLIDERGLTTSSEFFDLSSSQNIKSQDES